MTVGLVTWLLARADHASLATYVTHVHLGWLAVACALVPAQVLLGAARWRRMACDLGMSMSWRSAVQEYALSTFLNQVLPGGVTGDAVRVWRHRQGEGTVGPPLRAAVAERATGHVAHLLLTLLGLVLWERLHGTSPPAGSMWLVLGLLAVFGLAFAVPGRVPGLGTAARDARAALRSPGQLAYHAVVSGLLLLTFLAGFAACAAALGQALGWAVVTAIPLVMLVMVVPFSVAGWGLREASATVVLAVLGWSPEAALALSAAYGLSILVGSLPGAMVLLMRAPGRDAA